MPVLAAEAMAVADQAKAGVASGILNTSRQVGTALGVAVMASVGSTVARGDWTTFANSLPAAARSGASALSPLVVLGQGAKVGALAGQAFGAAAALMASGRAVSAFCDGMQSAFVTAAVVAVVAAGVAVTGLGRHRRAAPSAGSETPAPTTGMQTAP